MRWFGVLVASALLLTLASGAAGAAPTRDALVRPGVGIGELRLGMTLRQSLRALGQPVVFERARVFPRESLRYMEYRTKDGLWRFAVFGIRGRERLSLVMTRARRERTRDGIGVGTLVETLPRKLRVQRPVCVKRYPFLNYVYHHELLLASCAVRTPGLEPTTTVFGGSDECAVPVVRYQGCARPRYRVSSVFMESDELARFNLSWWYPVVVEPERPRTG
ncbi:MAG TPA: hypothetical protein VNP93_00935 [Gaiellaceae bacterium]|nr:hypothetical protein [Gaiellaceae bacterium]